MANVIGKLSLDISEVEKQVNKINQLLKTIGAGPKVDLSSQVAGEVKKQLDAIEKAISESVTKIQSASKRATDAFNGIGGGSKGAGSLQTSIRQITEESTTMGVAISGSGAVIEKFLGQTTAGYDALGRKVREVTDASGNIVKKIYNEQNAYKDALKILQDYYTKSAQMHALELGGKQNTSQYTKLASEVNSLGTQWANVNKHVQAVVLATDEAKRAADLYNNTMQALDAGKSAKDQETALKNLVVLYQEYYKTKAQADTYAQKGDILNADMYKGMSDTIKTYIDSIAQVNSQLDQEAQKKREVIEANLAYQATVQGNAYKEQQEAMTNYQNALVSMLTEQARFNQQVASGQLVEGTEKYAQSEEALKHLEQAAVQAGQKLDQAGRDAVLSMQSVQSAIDKVNISMGAVNDAQQVSVLDQVTNAYTNLKNAINQYNIAKKSGNDANMNYWQDQINGQMNVVSAIENGIDALNLEAGVREQINQKIQEAKTLHEGFTKGVIGSTQATSELESQLTGMATRMFSLMAVFRTINSLVQNTVEYVTEFSDKMNEIQIITKKSNSEVEQLGKTYMGLAEQMNVSSLDMADAAVYFTRQGLAAEEIEQRLVNVTRYAKTANVEFKDASEIITSVVNSMNLVEQEAIDGRNATQRVADVFLAVGDNAATSGQEIGEAMQKAAASAGAFGMSMEWLSAYIATVSETTRQEARTIGTAFNTIIARLHQIKQNGYNSEDETKINDVQKALAKIDIALMDQNNEWRNMDKIFQEIGEAWGKLDGKTKSYIATTMAGVKQQNVFLALMNDLGKHVDDITDGTKEGSRAWELYNIAIGSAGEAEEKYSIWTDSVAASQERLTIAQEKFYSLMDAGIIKGWNDAMARWLNTITSGADAMGALPGIIAGIGAAVAGFATASKIAQASLAGIENFFTRHSMITTIAAVAASLVTVLTVVSAIANATQEAKRRFESATKIYEEANEKMQTAKTLQQNLGEMYQSTGGKIKLSSKELAEYTGLLDDIAKISPEAKKTVDQFKEGAISQQQAYSKLNKELEQYIKNEQAIAAIGLMGQLNNITGAEDAQSKTVDLFQNWDKGWFGGMTGIEGFTIALQRAMAQTRQSDFDQSLGALLKYGKPHVSGTRYMTDEMYWQIDEMINNGVPWENVARSVWSQIFNTDVSYDIQQAVGNQMTQLIDKAVNIAGMTMDTVDTSAIRQKLVGMLFDPNGNAKYDIQEASSKINEFIGQMFDASFDPSKILTASERLTGFASSILGGLSSEMYDEVSHYAYEHPEAIDGISEAYSQMVEAGLSKVDLAKAYKNLPVNLWSSASDLLKTLILDTAGIEGLTEDNGIWNQLNLETLATVKNLMDMGVEFSEIEKILASSNSVEEFVDGIKQLGSEDGGLEEASDNTKDFADSIKDTFTELDKINSIIEAIKNNDTLDMEDIFSIGKEHSEIYTMLDDYQALQDFLEGLKESDALKAMDEFKQHLLDDADFAKDFKNQSNAEEIEAYVDNITLAWMGATGRLKDVSKETLGEWMTSMFSDANMDLLDRKILDFGDHIETMVTETFTASADGSEGMKWNKDIVMNFTPITPDGQKLDNDTFISYIEGLLAKSANVDELKAFDKVENGGLGLLISVDTDVASFDTAIEKATALAQVLHWLQEAYYGLTGAEEDWLATQAKEAQESADLEWAKSNNYIEQITALQEAMSGDGDYEEVAENAIAVWDSLGQTMQKAIIDQYPQIASAMHDMRDALDGDTQSAEELSNKMDGLNRVLSKSQKYANAKYFKDTWKAILDLSKGTTTAAKAFEAFNKDVDKYKKAQQEVIKANEKMSKGMDLEEEDVSALSDAIGKTAEDIIKDYPAAIDLFNQMAQAGDEAYAAMNREAVLRILGTSESDFSDIQGGLIAIDSSAQSAIASLMALGSFTIEDEDLPQTGKSFKPDDNGGGEWHTFTDNSNVTFLRFNAESSPLSNSKVTTPKTKSGGGGGGGGGGKKEKTEAVKMLDNMGKVDDIQKWQQSYYQSQQKYYESTGQLQGVIAYMEKEKDAINEQTASLTENVKKLEEWIAKKKAELSGLKESDDKYAEVSDDLEKLQKAYQDYTKQLVDNKTAVNDLNKAMKEQRDKIRDMEIDLRETILQAIEDRESKTENMLNAEVELEEKILDVITRRYEKERDQIIETTNLKIQALQEERDLLEEQLRLRKEQADEEDKAKKLKELELQYQRISADPTRAKEAKKIQKDIADLRKEMAWDAAEDEIKAQQDSLEQQEQSLEDYIDYVHEYYEDLFEHPKLLIAEMEEIMSQTSKQILEWLKANDEEYAEFTAAQQEKTTKEWQAMLDEREGLIRTYWEEVESIITQGDEDIIKFLQDNSEDYAAAGKLQAEKYTEEWQKKLDDLKKAHEEIVAEFAPDTEASTESEGDGSSGGGGGSGGGSGKKYKFTYDGTEYDGYDTEEEANAAIEQLAKADRDKAGEDDPNGGTVYEYEYNKANDNSKSAKGTVTAYKKGGLARFTGPAWLDGTQREPERILSPRQTKLFETMVSALESMSRISIPTMPNYRDIDLTGSSGNTFMGDIIVNVDNLDTDDDYEILARKVSEILMERIGRTSVVGGLRIRPF